MSLASAELRTGLRQVVFRCQMNVKAVSYRTICTHQLSIARIE